MGYEIKFDVDFISAQKGLTLIQHKDETVEVFVDRIPPRTSVFLAVFMKDDGTGEVRIMDYKCVDCDYKTTGYEEMMEHQRSYKHGVLARLSRWLKSRRTPSSGTRY